MQLMATEWSARVGARIREQRESRGWSQNELARAIAGRASANDVSRWERGVVLPNPSSLEVIAAALGVGVGDLVTPEPKPATPDLMAVLPAASGTPEWAQALDAKLDALLSEQRAARAREDERDQEAMGLETEVARLRQQLERQTALLEDVVAATAAPRAATA